MSIVGCSSSDDNGDGPLTDTGAVVDTATNDDTLDDDSLDSGPVEGISSTNFAAFGMRTIDSINLTQLTAERLRAEDLVNEIFSAGLSVLNGGEPMSGLTLGAQIGGEVDNSSPETLQAFICDEGGSLQLTFFLFTDAPLNAPTVNFSNCTVDGQTYNGTVELFSGRRVNTLATFKSYIRTSVIASEEGPEELAVDATDAMPTPQKVELDGEFSSAFRFFPDTENESWTNTTFSISGTDNDETLTITDWQRSGTNTHFPTDNSGFIQLLDGSTALVQLRQHGANFTADMQVSNTESNFEPVSVALNLSFTNNYYDFFDDAFSVFSVPSFPVSDLGTPLEIFSTPDFASASVQSVDSQPIAEAPQWRSGEIFLATQDTSSLRIQPDPELSDSILIELNGSGEQMSALWADGYQAFCPSVIDNCSQP